MSSRTCAKPGCTSTAAATLTYHYGNRTVWLENLAAESHPMQYDLCGEHADHLRAPMGWTVEDRRIRYPAAVPDALAS